MTIAENHMRSVTAKFGRDSGSGQIHGCKSEQICIQLDFYN